MNRRDDNEWSIVRMVPAQPRGSGTGMLILILVVLAVLAMLVGGGHHHRNHDGGES